MLPFRRKVQNTYVMCQNEQEHRKSIFTFVGESMMSKSKHWTSIDCFVYLPMTCILQMAQVSHSTSQLHIATAFHFFRVNIFSGLSFLDSDFSTGAIAVSSILDFVIWRRSRDRWLVAPPCGRQNNPAHLISPLFTVAGMWVFAIFYLFRHENSLFFMPDNKINLVWYI